jgi:diaminopimelate decarboxylase
MIRERVRVLDEAFRVPHTICYSVKANSNLSILRLLATMGCGFDVVSGGELERVLLAEPKAKGKVVFSGVGKTRPEMEAALKAGILMFNLESRPELDLLAACATRLKRRARIAFRVNPDVPANTHPYISTGLRQHKFGVSLAEALELYRRVRRAKFLEARGVSVHIGSQIRSAAPFRAALTRVAELVTELRQEGHQIDYVDAGGGLGISYQGSEDFRASAQPYARAVCAGLGGLKVQVLLEPGRAIVGAAGILLTRVLYRKANGKRKFLVVDAAMNDLIRPALYQAEHRIVPVLNANEDQELVDVVGPVCESGDLFARRRRLPKMRAGQLLAILDTGAYGMALASNYNSRPRAAEVLIDGRSVQLIRRREAVADLVRLER